MLSSRRGGILLVLILLVAINVLILSQMLGTVFFAITVAYIMLPVAAWIQRRGYSRWIASVAATVAAVLGAIALFVPLVLILYLRRDRIVGFIEGLPDEILVEALGFAYTVETSVLLDAATGLITDAAPAIALAAPIVAAKGFVFAFVVFALLHRRADLSRALLGSLPGAYHELARSYHERVRQTLFALYVTQALTGLATFIIAVPIFWAFGYDSPFTLGLAAGILQFLPVIGPSVVVLALVALELIQGAVVTAILLAVVGLALIGALPDVLLRPYLARRTAKLHASLYFVGFTGGVLSLGPIGIIAGPLAIALLAQTVSLLAYDLHTESVEEA